MRRTRFDTWTVALWHDARRRDVLHWLVELPLLSVLGMLVTIAPVGAAKHPVDRIQDRTQKRNERDRKKRRNNSNNKSKKNRRRQDSRGGPDCTPQRPLGQTCQRDCQCPSGARCDTPRSATERGACGQDPQANKVCCLADGETCATACDCCDGSHCINGVCINPCAGLPEGAVCATYTYEDVGGVRIPMPVRCCNRVCPPQPTCRPPGAYCPECIGNQPNTFQGCCTHLADGVCPSAPDAGASRCDCIKTSPRNPCVSDTDCDGGSQCRCGKCCTPNGGKVVGIGGGMCEDCCSGRCEADGFEGICQA